MSQADTDSSIQIIPNRYVKMIKMIKEKKKNLLLSDIQQFFNSYELHNKSKKYSQTQKSTNNNSSYCGVIANTLFLNSQKTNQEDERAQKRYKNRINQLYKNILKMYRNSDK